MDVSSEVVVYSILLDRYGFEDLKIEANDQQKLAKRGMKAHHPFLH
jgi:hypothetical protein